LNNIAFDEDDAFINEDRPIDKILKVNITSRCLCLPYIAFQGIPFETIISKCLQPPKVKDMAEVHDKNAIFMIKVNLFIINLLYCFGIAMEV
jgi:hypothetical protein